MLVKISYARKVCLKRAPEVEMYHVQISTKRLEKGEEFQPSADYRVKRSTVLSDLHPNPPNGQPNIYDSLRGRQGVSPHNFLSQYS